VAKESYLQTTGLDAHGTAKEQHED
jgi:hypothetical protein